jgi:hypothetical protein
MENGGWEALRRAKGSSEAEGAHRVACAGTDERAGQRKASGKARAKFASTRRE